MLLDKNVNVLFLSTKNLYRNSLNKRFQDLDLCDFNVSPLRICNADVIVI